MNIKAIIGATGFICFSLPAVAADVFLEGGLHFGGDKLATVSSSGPDLDLRAGQLLSFAIGGYAELADSLQGRFSLGYKTDSINADNGDATFTRFPVEALIMHQSGKFMLGGGIAYHLSPRFEFTAPPAFTIDFDNALGFVLAFDYTSGGKFEGNWYLGGRITVIDYEVKGLSVNGNSVGVVAGFMFE